MAWSESSSRGRLAWGAGRWALSSSAFSVGAWSFECLTIIAASVTSGLFYQLVTNRSAGESSSYFIVGALISIFYTLPFIFRDEYQAAHFVQARRVTGRILSVWTFAFFGLALVGFLTKSTNDFSRGWLLLFYGFGFVSLVAANAIIETVMRQLLVCDRIAKRKVMVVGSEEKVQKALREMQEQSPHFNMAASVSFPQNTLTDQDREETVAECLALARSLRLHDIVVLMDWPEATQIERLVEALAVLPIDVHVSAWPKSVSSSEPHLAKFGPTTVITVSSAPLRPLDQLQKRLFDISISAIALILLLPLLTAVALLVKIDSSGPIFFRQRRRGFNQEEFRIWKFRTMTSLDDGNKIKQAKKNDPRLTRIGAWLRRYNIDELPQLLNVIAGDMSLVGPRPHAVAHDLYYEKIIDKYGRRLKVKPGITGWAQVHGFRGPTETSEKMQTRVDYDVYYTENWTIALDIYILFLTIFGARSSHNAF